MKQCYGRLKQNKKENKTKVEFSSYKEKDKIEEQKIWRGQTDS
jgi:hypothetical protein